jgi:hypothetical protein
METKNRVFQIAAGGENWIKSPSYLLFSAALRAAQSRSSAAVAGLIHCGLRPIGSTISNAFMPGLQ